MGLVAAVAEHATEAMVAEDCAAAARVAAANKSIPAQEVSACLLSDQWREPLPEAR